MRPLLAKTGRGYGCWWRVRGDPCFRLLRRCAPRNDAFCVILSEAKNPWLLSTPSDRSDPSDPSDPSDYEHEYENEYELDYEYEHEHDGSRAGTIPPGTRNPEPGTRNPEPGTRNPEPGTRNPEPGTLNPHN
jgi:hypothetical protein